MAMRLDPATTVRVLAAAEPSTRRPFVEAPVPKFDPAPAARVRRRAARPALVGPAAALEVVVPLATANETNERHWRARSRRAQAARHATLMALTTFNLHCLPRPWLVTLTRLGGGKMDSDGLQAALKSCRDAVACWLFPGSRPGERDDDPAITWRYAQEPGRGGWGVRIRIETT